MIEPGAIAGRELNALITASIEIAGWAAVTGKTIGRESSPPGFSTVISVVPADAVSSAGTEAVRREGFRKVVGSRRPFHWTAAAGARLEPLTSRTNAPEAAATDAGARLMSTGGETETSKIAGAEIIPPGFMTVTAA